MCARMGPSEATGWGNARFSILEGGGRGLLWSARVSPLASTLPWPCGPSPHPSPHPWHLGPRDAGKAGPWASIHPSLCSLGSKQSFWIHFSRQEEAGKTLR